MKILVSIQSDDVKAVGETLSWAARAGFNLRLFISNADLKDQFYKMIDELNYEHYLDLQYAMVIAYANPDEFAVNNGFDIHVKLPAGLKRWNKSRIKERMIIEYAADIGKQRQVMSNDENLQRHVFENETVMVRL